MRLDPENYNWCCLQKHKCWPLPGNYNWCCLQKYKCCPKSLCVHIQPKMREETKGQIEHIDCHECGSRIVSQW